LTERRKLGVEKSNLRGMRKEEEEEKRERERV